MLGEQVLKRRDDTRLAAFAGQEQRAQMAQPAAPGDGVEMRVFRVIFADGADGGGRCEEDVGFVFFDNPPEGAGVRGADRFAFEEDGGCAYEKGRVQDVGMAYYPADILGAEHDVAGAVDVEEVFDGEVQADCVSACFSKDAFGESSRAYSVRTTHPIHFQWTKTHHWYK